MAISEVEIVLTNWKRKHNLPKVVDAMREQSVASTITLIDNASEDSDAVDVAVIESVDKYYRIGHNPYGPFIRLACHGFYDADFIFVYDDDMIPGRRCVEHFLTHAKANPQYGLLGQFGRKFDGKPFHFNTLEQSEGFTSVDLCICAYFINRSIWPFISEIKRRVVRAKAEHLFMQDDMLLAAGCKSAGKEIVLTPKAGKETSVKIAALPTPFSLAAMPGRPKIRADALELIRSEICPGVF